MNFTKIIYLALSIILLMSLPFLTSSLDWSNGWFLPLAVLALTIVLAAAAVNFQTVFLFIIFILPFIISYNYLKIDIFSRLPILNDFSFYFNPASLIYILIIIFGLSTVFAKAKELKSLPLKYIILIASAYGAASIFWSADKQTSLIELIYLLVPFSMYLMAYAYFKNAACFLKLIFISVLSSIIPLIAAAGQIISGGYFYEQDSSLGRLTGTLDHPNTFGLYLFLIIGLLIVFYLAKDRRQLKNNKLIFGWLAALLFFFVLTYSRTSWFCLAVLLILLILAERKIIFFWLAAAPLGGFLILLFENIRSRVLEIFDNTIFSSMTARINIWQVALEQIQAKPFFGHGLGLSETVIENAKPWRGGMSLPHNDYLLQALELGAIGLIIFLAYAFGAIYYAYDAFKKLSGQKITIYLHDRQFIINFKILSLGLMAILIALLPATLFESLSQKIIVQIIIWSILGSLFSLTASLKKEAA